MKKYIPAPIKESLKFQAEPKADAKSSTSQSKTEFKFPTRQIRISAPGVQAKIEDKALGVTQRASGEGTIIKGNHPRNAYDATDACSEV